MQKGAGISRIPKRAAIPVLAVIALLVFGLYLEGFPETGPRPGLEEEDPFYIGTWSGIEPEYGEEFIVRFEEEGTMFLVSPQYGYGTEFIYHAIHENGTYYLEIFDSYNEEWGVFFQLDQDEDELIISVVGIGEFIRAAPEEDARFVEEFKSLKHYVSPMEMIYGTLVETGLGMDEDYNIIEPRSSFAVDEAFVVFFDNGIPFDTEQILIRIRDGESGAYISEVAYDVDPDWTAMFVEEPFIISEPGKLELLFIVGDRVRAVHEVSAY